MNYETARTTLASMITNAVTPYPTLPVFWDNTNGIDLAKVADLCLLVEFYWDDTAQMDMRETPSHRTTGSVYLTTFIKEGTGTKKALALADTLTNTLKFRNESGVVTTLISPGRRQNRDGWVSQEWHLPFYFDSIP